MLVAKSLTKQLPIHTRILHLCTLMRVDRPCKPHTIIATWTGESGSVEEIQYEVVWVTRVYVSLVDMHHRYAELETWPIDRLPTIQQLSMWGALMGHNSTFMTYNLPAGILGTTYF